MATKGNCREAWFRVGRGGVSGGGDRQNLRDQWDLSVEKAENSRQAECISGQVVNNWIQQLF